MESLNHGVKRAASGEAEQIGGVEKVAVSAVSYTHLDVYKRQVKTEASMRLLSS